MAYRFIDTNFFKSPYVRGLQGTMKSLYVYFICDCSNAGIWAVDVEAANMYLGQKATINEIKKAFIETGKAIDLNNGKWFFSDFIQHQYPKGLSEKNPAHNNLILELKKYSLIDNDLQIVKSLSSPLQGTKVMVMDKVKEEVKVKESEGENIEIMPYPTFDDFWDAYDKKVGEKERIGKKFNSLPQTEKELIMQHIPLYKESQPDKKFRKDPATYLNNKSWNDEIINSQPLTKSEKLKKSWEEFSKI